MRRPLTSLNLLVLAALLLLAGCQKVEQEELESIAPELPTPALSERAQRDSARVANLVVAYFGYVARGDDRRAFELFYPDSIPVATADGGLIVEGRSQDAIYEMNQDRGAEAFGEIVLLRKTTTELLETTYRETWLLHYRLEDADSILHERNIHVLRQLGDDVRFLGRMRPDSAQTAP